MGTSATVFFSIDCDGEPRALSSQAWSDGHLEGLGRLLWLGSNGIDEQSRLCSVYGGYLPMMGFDGSFVGWFDSDSMDSEPSALRMSKKKPFKGIALGQIEIWMDSLATATCAGDLPAAFEKFLSSIDMASRLGGKLGFGEADSGLLVKDLPTMLDVFGSAEGRRGGAKKRMPILAGQASAAILARTMREIDQGDEVPDFLSMGASYLHAQGRWLTTLEYVQNEDPIIDQAPRGAAATAIWIPVSQALAITGGFDGSISEFLSGHAGPLDRQDLLDLASAVPSERFFQGAGGALAWAESKRLALEMQNPAKAGKKPGL